MSNEEGFDVNKECLVKNSVLLMQAEDEYRASAKKEANDKARCVHGLSQRHVCGAVLAHLAGEREWQE